MTSKFQYLVVDTKDQRPEMSFQPINQSLQGHRPYNLPIPNVDSVQGETHVFRNAKVVNGIPHTPENGLNTLLDLVHRNSAKFGNNKAFGSRTPEQGQYSFVSYSEHEELARNIGGGLVSAGLQASSDKICIWAQTRLVYLVRVERASEVSADV